MFSHVGGDGKLSFAPKSEPDDGPADAAAYGQAHTSAENLSAAGHAVKGSDGPKPREAFNREMYRIPSYAGWFSWGKIHPIERRALGEFFDGYSLSKTPKVYKEYREFIINKYRENPRRVLTFTEVRKMLVGDVNLLKKVFDFLEFWGLINYHVSSENKQQQTTTTDEKSPEKEMITESTDIAGPGNNTVTLEASPQFVSTSVVSSCQAGESSSQMPLQPLDTDQSENVPSQTDEHTTAAAAVPLEAGSKVQLPHGADWLGNWTIQEVLRLLEAIGKFGEDWNRVAAHVGTKSKLDCVLKFIKLPFGDQFHSNIGAPHYSTSNGGAMEEEIPRIKGECKDTSIGSSHLDGNGSHEHFDSDEVIDEPPLKRPELSPFADSSNPIFAQVAFLSAMVGSRVAALAAQAAVTALAEDDPVTHGLHTVNNHNQATSLKPEDAEGGDVHSGKERISAVSGAVTANAKTLADQEERDIEHILANMIEIQFKKLQSKVEHYEELEFILEKEKSQLEKAESQVLGDWIRYSHYHYSYGPS